MNDRTYSQEEIAALLERAAELQTDEVRNSSDKPGLTLSEIESVASEAGINPLLVRQAAAEMAGSRRVPHLKSQDQNATHVIVERVVPGTMTDHIWEDIVMELKHRYDSDLGKMMGMPDYGLSKTEKIGRSVEWKHTSMSGIETRVLIRPRGEQLNVRLSQRVGWGSPVAESSTYGLILAFFLALVSGAVADSMLMGIIVSVMSLAAIIPLIHWADTAWRKKKHRELDELADRLVELVGPAEPLGALTDRAPAVDLQARLDAALLESEEPEEAEKQVSRSRERQR